MKRVITNLASLVLVAVSWAQSPIELVHFIENKQVKISCVDCAEPAGITINNERTGGKRIYDGFVETVAGSSVNLGDNFPAFGIHTLTKKYLPISDPSFDIVQLDYDSTEISAYIRNFSDIELELVRSENGQDYETVFKIPTDILTTQKIPLSARDFHYKLNFRSSSSGSVYTSKPILVKGVIDIRVYPTLAQNTVSIETKEGFGKHSISISNVFGKTLAKYEYLDGSLLTLPLENFASGVLFITIRRTNTRSVFKIIYL